MNKAAGTLQDSIRPASASARALAALMCGAVFLTAGWVFASGQREVRADFIASPARLLTQRWAEGLSRPASRTQWEAVVSDLRRAADIQPNDPALQETLGIAWLAGSTQPWATEPDKVKWANRAIEHFQRSIDLRPRDGLTWALLASGMARAGNTGPAMHEAVQRALVLGPHEGHVHQTVMMLVLEYWDSCSQELQTWATNLFDHATQAQREAINQLGKDYGIAFETDVPARKLKAPKSKGAS